jgi:hypothetical protein
MGLEADVEIKQSSRARPSRARPSVLALDDVSTLTEGDEDALEAIRRQLDTEFSHWSGTVEPAAHGDHAPAAPRSLPRARRAATAIGTLVLACAAGSAAGVLVTVLYAKHVVAPTVARESPPPTTVTVTRPSRPPSPPVVPVRARTDARAGTITERPHLPAPASTPQPEVAAPVAGAPEVVPVAPSPSPPATPALTPDPPITREAVAAAEPAAAPPATPTQLRRDSDRFKRDVEQAPGAPAQKSGPVPEAP